MEKGFTIIELVISIFILSVAVVGIFGAFSVVTILTSDSADRLTATYLTQEGMEIVRNIRDTNWLNIDVCDSGYNPNQVQCPAFWIDNLNCSSGCQADFTTGTNIASPMNTWAGTGNYLMVNSSGFYNYASGTSSKFKRKIVITPIVDINDSNPENPHILKVKTEVAWDQKASILNDSALAGDVLGKNCIQDNGKKYNNCIVAEETLYNWYNIPNSGNAMLDFDLGYGSYGEVDEILDDAINVIVPYETDVTDLMAYFSTSPGSSVLVGEVTQTSGFDVHDFSNPVTYTVVAGDKTRHDYLVTVTVAPAPD